MGNPLAGISLRHRRRSARRPAVPAALAAIALGCSALVGCAGFWDEVTSREFSVKSMFAKPDPLIVLRDSDDGDARAKALRALHEPKRSEGTDEDQDMVLKILTTAAVSERQPLCRLAAIEALGRFQDSRAVQALIDAYYSAGSVAQDERWHRGLQGAMYHATAMPLDVVTRIHCQVVTALGETRQPAAMEFLMRVAQGPRPEAAAAWATTGDQDKQQTMDLRIAAVRALGNFNQRQAADTLVGVLQTEQDVALRQRAYDSLQACTGMKLPPDPNAWREALERVNNGPDGQLAQDRKKKVFGLFELTAFPSN